MHDCHGMPYAHDTSMPRYAICSSCLVTPTVRVTPQACIAQMPHMDAHSLTSLAWAVQHKSLLSYLPRPRPRPLPRPRLQSQHSAAADMQSGLAASGAGIAASLRISPAATELGLGDLWLAAWCEACAARMDKGAALGSAPPSASVPAPGASVPAPGGSFHAGELAQVAFCAPRLGLRCVSLVICLSSMHEQCTDTL